MITRTWRVGSHVVVSGRRWRIVNVTAGDDCEALRLIGVGTRDPVHALTVLVPFDRPIEQDASRTPKVFGLRRWLHELDRVVANVHPFGALASIARAAIRLLPYQLEPALAVVRHGATHVLIADAVGLGKTIQAGVMLAELHAVDDGFRALVLAPAGLREQWASELRVQFGLAATVADAEWLRRTIADRPLHVNPWSLAGIYVSSHDFVKRPEALRPLEDVSWDLVIVDEAHHAATGTDRRAAIDAIASRSLRVVLLTATPPVEPIALDALCRIGRTADTDAAPLLFARGRSDVDNSVFRRTSVLTVTPSSAEARMHTLLNRYSAAVWKEAAARRDEGAGLASIVLRKRALSSAGSLAASVERRIALLVSPDAEQLMLPLDDEDPLDDEARADILAVPGLADCRRERRWLGVIAEAARTASRAETKMLFLLRLLRRIQEPVIVFTEYRDTLLRIHRYLAATGRSIALLHGGMDPAERSRVPHALANGVQTLLATDAAAEGLNLHQRCRIVVHYELPWNPARLEQRAGRVDRIGQSRRVHEIALVAASTAERLVIAPLTMRAARARPGSGGNRLLGVLTESRIAEMVIGGTLDVIPDSPARGDVSEDRFRVESAEEADRVQHVRMLIRRSSASAEIRTRAAAPFVSRTRRARSRSSFLAGMRNSVALLYSISIEADSVRPIHEEIVVLSTRVASVFSRASTSAAMRALVAGYARPSGSVGRALETSARRALERVASGENRRRQHLDDRRRAIEIRRRSAARRLVQLGLFRRHRVEPEGEPAPTSPPVADRAALQVHTKFVAALLVAGMRGPAA